MHETTQSRCLPLLARTLSSITHKHRGTIVCRGVHGRAPLALGVHSCDVSMSPFDAFITLLNPNHNNLINNLMLKILSVRRRRGAQRLPFVGLARICMIQKQKSCPRAVQRSGLYGDVVPNTGCCCALRGEVAKKRYKNSKTKENIR